MVVIINNETYYRTAEACKEAGITKSTYLRWVTNGNIKDVTTRDRRGWRLFRAADVESLKKEVNRINPVSLLN